MPGDRFLRGLEDDGLYTPPVKLHSVEKITIHNSYLSLFTTAMRDKWPQLAYLGLYSGAGRARIESSGEIIETTAMSAFRTPYPFTKYVFVDNDSQCIEALQGRIATLGGERDVTFIESDVKEAVPDIIAAMPTFGPGRGLLSFCFLDPFSAALDFDVIRSLGSRYKMDFLILLMLGRDVRTNFQKYLDNPLDERIAGLIDDPNWRDEWRAMGRPPKFVVRFILERFDAAMTRLGYEAARPSESHPIRIAGKGVFLYSLVFYSRNPLGKKFWEATRQGADPQGSLGL